MSINWIQIKSHFSQLVKDTNFDTRRINFKIISSKNMNSYNEPVIKIIRFPLIFTTSDLKEIFSCFGKIEIISIPHKQKISERYAYIK